MTAAGCSATTSTRLAAASQDKGRAAARVTLPPYPAKCRDKIPHAALTRGTEILGVLDRERAQLDRANAKGALCGPGFYDDLRRRLH